MARFQDLAIPNLKIEENKNTNKEELCYKTRKIQLKFGVVRDVGLLNYLVKERELYIKVNINNKSVIQSYQKVDNFEYNTSKNYGRYAVGKYEIYLPTIEAIKTIEIWGAFDSSGKDEFKGYYDLTDNYLMAYNIGVNDDGGYYANTYGIRISEITYSKEIVNKSPMYLTVRGCSQDGETYISPDYHCEYIKVTPPTLYFLDEPFLNFGEVEITNYDADHKYAEKLGAEILVCKKDSIIIELRGDGKVKDLNEPYFTFRNTIYGIEYSDVAFDKLLSLFSFQPQGNLKAKAYQTELISEGNNKKIEQYSYITGEIDLLSLSPFIQNYFNEEGDYQTFSDVTISKDGDSQSTGKSIDFHQGNKSLWFEQALCSEKYKFDCTEKKWQIKEGDETIEVEEPIFLSNKENYTINFNAKTFLSGRDVSLKYSLKGIEVDCSSEPLFLNEDANIFEINASNSAGKTKALSDLNKILNPYEGLNIKIDLDKIYIPELKALVSSEKANLDIYLLIQQGQSFKEPKKNIHKTALSTLSWDEIEKYLSRGGNFTENLILKIGYTTQVSNDNNTNIDINDLTFFPYSLTFRVGRTKPIIVSKCFISGNTLTYQLSDWGGDKTTNTNGNSFVPFKSSFYRTGQEELTLEFFKYDGKTKTSKGTITKKMTDRNYFLENVEHSIDLSNLLKDQNIDISEINMVSGTYNYSFDGNNDTQIVNLQDTNKKTDISIENNSNNPTLSIRKNGLIINGKPGQELTEVLDENNKSIGKYFIEISALDNTDRFILKYPNGNCQFEIFNNEGKICISTINKAKETDELETTSAYLTDILTLAKIT